MTVQGEFCIITRPGEGKGKYLPKRNTWTEWEYGWKSLEVFTEDFATETWIETYTVLPLALLQNKTRSESHHQTGAFFPRQTFWVGAEAEIAHEIKSFSSGAPKDLSSHDFGVLATLPDPTVGLRSEPPCWRPELRHQFQGSGEGAGLPKQERSMGLNVTCGATWLPCAWALQCWEKPRPLKNEMFYHKAFSGLEKEELWEHFDKQSSLLVHLFTLSLVLQWFSLKLQHQFIQINCIIVCNQTISIPDIPQKCDPWVIPFEKFSSFWKMKVKCTYFFLILSCEENDRNKGVSL